MTATKRVTVKRGDKTYVYLKLVEFREDDLKASGQLEALAASFAALL
jgi:hypothetical protein